MEIEQRLGLYQVFLKLYQYHRGLLDEILQLETTGHKTFASRAIRYVMGVCGGQQAYLVTNLVGGRTQTLLQRQGIWTIGRDRQLTLSIPDPHLSRHHAVIQYRAKGGFYLVDLNSTNGSFLNGEPVYGRVRLKDGDRIRISSLAFYFFLCQDIQTLEAAPPTILAKLETSTGATPALPIRDRQKAPTSKVNLERLPSAKQAVPPEGTSHFLTELTDLEEPIAKFSIPQLSPLQKSQILDRFFNRQIPKITEDS
ncbi:MAG TPA: phosphopeptide-binding protein [Cyanobacteria bacterium UBA9273]|nr:phosphopeptide-binding protein [Cyanobacteria bacterium UBA9273]